MLGILVVPLAAAAQQPTKVRRIGMLSTFSPELPQSRAVIDAFQQGLRELGWVEGQNISASGERRRIVDLAANSRLPAIYAFREAVDAGGLMAYGASIPDLFRRAATYADKILRGVKLADLPVEQAFACIMETSLPDAWGPCRLAPQEGMMEGDVALAGGTGVPFHRGGSLASM